MDHLFNWVEIPVANMKRAMTFYGELLGLELGEMKMGGNDYALFPVADKFNTGALVSGEGYVPATEGTVVYVNGGRELARVLSRVKKLVERCSWKKPSFLRKQAISPTFVTPRATRLGYTAWTSLCPARCRAIL